MEQIYNNDLHLQFKSKNLNKLMKTGATEHKFTQNLKNLPEANKNEFKADPELLKEICVEVFNQSPNLTIDELAAIVIRIYTEAFNIGQNYNEKMLIDKQIRCLYNRGKIKKMGVLKKAGKTFLGFLGWVVA